MNNQKKDLLIIFISIVIFSITSFLALYSYELYTGKDNFIFIGAEPEKNILQRKLAYISGAINKPGIYEISENMRISELVILAGGFKENVDKNYINQTLNLARVIEDQEHLYIPYEHSNFSSSSSPYSPSPVINSELININTASLNELDSLPEIGPSTADKIIEARPFSSIDQLLDVSGIGEKTFEKIRDLITV